MLFTIGYRKLTLAQLKTILDTLEADLADVRSVPWSRHQPEFRQKALAEELGKRYFYVGDHLGGRAPVTKTGIEWCTKRYFGRNTVLMCLEHAPGNCHRHITICGPHFPEARHIHEGDLILARELDRAIKLDADYPIFGTIAY